jgi:hypothetical protein
VIKKNMMPWTHGICEGQARYLQCWWGILRERGNLVEVGVNGRIILKWVFKEWYGAVDMFILAQVWET